MLRDYHHQLLADATHVTPNDVLVLDGDHCIHLQVIGFRHLDLWSVDLRRLWHRAPIFAARLNGAVWHVRHVGREGRGWGVADERGTTLARPQGAQRRLDDYLPELDLIQPRLPRAKRPT